MIKKLKNELEEERRIRRKIYIRNYMRKYIKGEKCKLSRKLYREKMQLEIKQKIGSVCRICGSTKNIIYHEIHGQSHTCYPSLILNFSQNFIPLCRYCHSTLNRLYTLKRQNKIKVLIELLDNIGS